MEKIQETRQNSLLPGSPEIRKMPVLLRGTRWSEAGEGGRQRCLSTLHAPRVAVCLGTRVLTLFWAVVLGLKEYCPANSFAAVRSGEGSQEACSCGNQKVPEGICRPSPLTLKLRCFRPELTALKGHTSISSGPPGSGQLSGSLCAIHPPA